jgi:4-hydroxymandelate oxidase
MSSESQPINLLDYEQLARDKLSKSVYDYYAGGADDGITLRENKIAFERLQLLPRILVDVSQRDTSTTLLGKQIPAPIVIAPMALAGMAHPLAEMAIALGADGIPMALSTLSSTRLEDLAATEATPFWFQLYVYRDRDITQKLVERAEAAGYQALVVTVDVAAVGNRERDRRNQFKIPGGVTLKNLDDASRDKVADAADNSAIAAYVSAQIDPSLTWQDIDWLRSITKLPVLIKGILSPADARLAVEHGAAGIIVSNHGGRQLDTVPAAIDVLPEIAAEVGDMLEIMLDSGIRRGTDILKALALGAKAVMIGRPVMWGVAVGGESGVRQVLEILRTEFDTALALSGCTAVGDITADLIWRPRPHG